MGRHIRHLITPTVIAAAVLSLSACGNSGSAAKPESRSAGVTSTTVSAPVDRSPSSTISGNPSCPNVDGTSAPATSFPEPPPMCIDPAGTYRAEIKTSEGTFTVALDAQAAPRTVNNFVVLARSHFYDGLTFHRVVPGFVLQGGDPKGTGSGGPGYKFADELPKAGQYRLGSLAMANSGPDTNGSQFFVISGDQGVKLDPKYSLFGQVTDGLDVVRKIDALGNPDDRMGKPTKPITMSSVTITES